MLFEVGVINASAENANVEEWDVRNGYGRTVRDKVRVKAKGRGI